MSKVLIVDDEGHYREHLARALARDGHEVETAANARDAIARGCRFRPDVLIADWMLKNHIHGLHVSEVLRAVVANVYTILITGFPSDDLRTNAKQVGVGDFIEKPFDLDQMRAAVREGVQSAPAGRRQGFLPVIEVSADGSILFTSRAAQELFAEAQVSEAVTNLADLFSPGPMPDLDAAVARWVVILPRTPRPVIWHIRSQIPKDGGSRLVVLRRQNEPQHLGHTLIEMLLDVTEPKFVRWPFEHRVLVLDQDALSRRASVNMLESAGAGCYACASLPDAVQLLQSDDGLRYVILDFDLTDSGMAAAIEHMRTKRPGVVIVGTGEDERRETSAAAGADHFLPKPWRVDILINLLMGRIGNCIECGLLLPLRWPRAQENATNWVCRFCGAHYHAIFDDSFPTDVLTNASPADHV